MCQSGQKSGFSRNPRSIKKSGFYRFSSAKTQAYVLKMVKIFKIISMERIFFYFWMFLFENIFSLCNFYFFSRAYMLIKK